MRRKLAVFVSAVLSLWRIIDWTLDQIGVIDTVQGLMQPTHWAYRVIFWPHLGNMMTAIGVLGILALVSMLRKGGDPQVAVLQTADGPQPRTAVLHIEDRAQAELLTDPISVFYDPSDPNCYQTPGSLEVRENGVVVRRLRETIYRIGVRSRQQLNECRVILEDVDPRPLDPGMQRIGLALRPRLASPSNPTAFTVHRGTVSYVEVLQETVPEPNPMHEAAQIRLMYAHGQQGQSRVFEHGDYVLTLTLQARDSQPRSVRLKVEFDRRRQARRWNVSQVKP